MLEGPQCAAAIVEPDPMRKLRPRERFNLQDVMQKLHELEGVYPDLLNLRRLLDRVEIVAHVMDAAPRWGDDVIETGKIADEEGFGVSAIRVETAIRHRLAATRLIAGVNNLMSEPFKEFERGDAYFRKESVDIARNEKPDAHAPSSSSGDATNCRPCLLTRRS